MDDLKCAVHYVYDVKHLYLGSIELLVPQFKHLRGKLMPNFI